MLQVYMHIYTKNKFPFKIGEEVNPGSTARKLPPIKMIDTTSQQIRASQRSITVNFRPFKAHIYHIMIIVTGGFSKVSFFY